MFTRVFPTFLRLSFSTLIQVVVSSDLHPGQRAALVT